MLTRLTLSQKAVDLLLIESTMVTHQEAINAKLEEITLLPHVLSEPIRRVMFDCLKREIRDLSTQLEAMSILHDDIAACDNYPARLPS